MNQVFLDQLYRDEGCVLKPYLCSRGYWTIGVGRNLETNGLTEQEQLLFFGKTMPKAEVIEALKLRSISKEEAHSMLLNDLFTILMRLSNKVSFVGHDPVRCYVLLNMAFQLGLNGLLNFKNSIRLFNNKDYKNCAVELLDSLWAIKQTPNRANRLSKQMATGEWQ